MSNKSLNRIKVVLVEKQRTKVADNNDLLDNGGFYWFAAKASLNNNDVGVLWSANYRHIGVSSSNESYGLRPVISLSSSVYVIDGSGTLDDPYIIEN